ncbi:hypothetical protein [Janthinobacterium sp. PC23-8]|uniref:hypothetical protein n=1 Tax=Janthinobacterium sp. PC23-8 TaxID=2012679 RepID=UPI000B97541F|nr:hypothetical protein [Janthinobacterium sp. PC23-8]OYO30036.1 hypothetical protein CD932_01960 [Janthinobacterium sp. PC23-8]
MSSIVFAVGFALLLAGVTKLETAAYVNIPAFLCLVGDASYTIYLVHLALEGVLLKLSMKMRLDEFAGAGATYILVLAGTIALGCVAYLLIERPLLARLRRRRVAGPVFS